MLLKKRFFHFLFFFFQTQMGCTQPVIYYRYTKNVIKGTQLWAVKCQAMTNASVIICCWKVGVHAFLTFSTYNFPHVHQTLKTSCKLHFPRNLMSFTAQACFKGRLINLHCWEQSTVGQNGQKSTSFIFYPTKKSAVTDHPDMCGFLYWETVYLGRFLPHHIECHLDIKEQLMSHTLTAHYFSPVT